MTSNAGDMQAYFMNEQFIGKQQPIGHTGSIKNTDECPHKHNMVTASLACIQIQINSAFGLRLEELLLAV